MGDSSPLTSRRELGARLKRLRTAAGLTAAEVAQRLLASPTKISRLETGDRPPQLRDVRDLCELYAVGDDEGNTLMALATRAREHGWWDRYDLGAAASTWAGLEASAHRLRIWSPLLVPGLLQTAAYADAVLTAVAGTAGPGQNLGHHVAARAERQKRVLHADGPQLQIVLGEAALRTEVGGHEVMRRQWERLLVLAQEPQISLQYAGFAAGAHPGLQGPFVIAEFGTELIGDVVLIEGAGQQFLERPAEIARFGQAFDELAGLAHPPARTAQAVSELIAVRPPALGPAGRPAAPSRDRPVHEPVAPRG